VSNELAGKTIAFLAADGVEQPELTQPWQAVVDAGGTPRLLSLAQGRVQAFTNDVEAADTFAVDAVVAEADPSDFDALVLPGGTTNPDKLRVDADVLSFVRGAFDAGLPVAAICHAPWTLVSAGLVAGRTMTSYPSVADDLRNAGAIWVDQAVVVDGGLITSRTPDDLPAFSAALLRVAAAGTPAKR